MPISENVSGVLHIHSAEYENIGGVIREKSAVTVNDGGVIKSVFSADKVKVEGITPLVEGDDFMVITASGTGTISLPSGARIILGSGGYGISGGCVAEHTLSSAVKNASFTSTVSGVSSNLIYRRNSTRLVIDGVAYSCGDIEQIIQTKWGPIGGKGGSGQTHGDEVVEAEDGTGAGGGGGIDSGTAVRKGGNNGGYGNFGGNGGSYANKTIIPSTDGSSGKGSTRGRSGGGGGYAAGGGEAAAYATKNEDDSVSYRYNGDNGEPGAGIIVIEW